MSAVDAKIATRVEAERLIDLARGLLNEPAEEIAAIYLDHALDALRAIPAEPGTKTRDNPA
ncbi:hypothetical protein DRN02_010845 [Sphingomonas paucimobilis]|uniref:hypothetical protein n=1 Tax=Sphingomonas paucimobilis TaxID=13689 RepID=UPI000DE40420|nr:hypothetical protein [Sphingomonas paucimobilis]QBE92463.1 hypothetical protein DRN02_010845 [Sphingomonas paucimobilis]